VLVESDQLPIEPAEDLAGAIDKASAQLVEKIRTHIAKGDRCKEKAEQHYIAAGQHLRTLKAEHKGSWSEWEELIKNKIGIGKSRASELMQIADGTKTAESVASDRRERQRKAKAIAKPKLSVVDGENDGAPEGGGPAPTDGNGADPEVAAEAMKAKFAAMDDADGAPAIESPVTPAPESTASSEPEPAPTRPSNAATTFEAMWEASSADQRKDMLAQIPEAMLLAEVKRRKLLPNHDAKLTRLLRSGLSVLRQANGSKAAAGQKVVGKLVEMNSILGERKLGVGDIEIFAS
jgi:hypothetical protein